MKTNLYVCESKSFDEHPRTHQITTKKKQIIIKCCHDFFFKLTRYRTRRPSFVTLVRYETTSFLRANEFVLQQFVVPQQSSKQLQPQQSAAQFPHQSERRPTRRVE